MVEIKWSFNALSDIEDIAGFIAKDSEYYARLTVQRLFASVQRLSAFPLSGRLIPELANENYREIIAENYRIMYRFYGSAIDILTLIHCRRNTEFLTDDIF